MIKQKDLTGTGYCSVKRNKDIGLSSRGSDIAKKSAFMRELTKKGLQDKSIDVEGEARAFFNSLGSESDEGKRLEEEDAARQVRRYLACETRKAHAAAAREIDIFGETVLVEPDVFFIGDREFERSVAGGGKKSKMIKKEPYIEMVRFEAKKPDVSLRGRKRDAGVMTSLKMYALHEYAKDFAESLLEEGVEVNIGASLYFLRKTTDSADYFNPQFWQTEKGERPNFVTLWDKITVGERKPTNVDIAYKPQFEAYLEGEDMKGSDSCRWCEYRPACYYCEEPGPVDAGLSEAKSIAGVRPSASQAEAVAFDRGFARINAGAGSGKTLTVALRAARLISDGTEPGKIVILTFTNAGAAEFRERVAAYRKDLGCGEGGGDVVALTFNSFGNEIVKENYARFGFASEPRLLEDVERMGMIADILKPTRIPGLDYRHFSLDMPNAKGALPVTQKAFDIFKRMQITGCGEEACGAVLGELGKDARFTAGADTVKGLFSLYGEYQEALKKACLIEYADQELLALEVLGDDPGYIAGKGYEHVIVDEFQDTNDVQFKILEKLVEAPSFKSLMVVGDDSQAIYGFRGSSPEFIMSFEEKLGKECENFYLLENHRSTPEIIKFANRINALNEHRIKKDLEAVRPSGKPVTVRAFNSQEGLDAFLLATVEDRHAGGVPYEDMAFIAYTRNELLRAKGVLSGAGIPCAVMSPEPCFENDRVMAATAFAALVNDRESSKDAYAYINAASCGKLGEASAEEARLAVGAVQEEAGRIRLANDEAGFDSALAALLAGPGGEQEDETYSSFLEAVSRRKGLDAKLRYCADFLKYGERQCAKRERKYPGVVLVTAHSSKGKEYPVVINSVTKYDAEGLTDGETEERRRLLFVSATRARDELYVCGKRTAFGSEKNGTATPNRFLEEAAEAARQ